jgi:hypothetical protein
MKRKIGYAVLQLVEALCYKPEDHGFHYRGGNWDFSSSSFIVIPWIRTGLQNPYGYGNSHLLKI